MLKIEEQSNNIVDSVVSNMSNLVFFIGMMGCGKTVVGKAVAKKLGMDFIDMDSEIEKEEGISINEIFATKGEFYFRSLERDMLQKLSMLKKTIISCGGGVFLAKENIERINSNGISIFLNTNESIILQRLKKDKHRPLLKGNKSPLEILKERLPFYRQATITVDITKSDTEANVINCIESLSLHLQSDIKYAHAA